MRSLCSQPSSLAEEWRRHIRRMDRSVNLHEVGMGCGMPRLGATKVRVAFIATAVGWAKHVVYSGRCRCAGLLPRAKFEEFG